jgi:membrane fusion protein (multidrug efflux system)
LPQQRLPELTIGLPVRITLGADAEAPLDGKLAALDPALDPATRSIKARADVSNPSERLRPGMFVSVSVILPESGSFVTIPATAVVHAPYGDSVFIVEDKKPDAPGMRTTPDGKPVKTAHQQFVRLGRSRGDFVAIVDGVKPQQEVVSSGAFKLRNNAPVVVDNTKQPTPQLAPHPENR